MKLPRRQRHRLAQRAAEIAFTSVAFILFCGSELGNWLRIPDLVSFLRQDLAPLGRVRWPGMLALNAMSLGQPQIRRVVAPVVAIGVILSIWQVLGSNNIIALPPPSRVLDDTWDLIVDPFFDNGGTDKGMFWQLSASLIRVAMGYTLAAVVGISLGILVGSIPIMREGLDPIFQVLRTVPPLAWLPISLAAFKDANPSAIFVIFITAIWPILLNTAVGVQQIPQDYMNVAKVLRLSPPKYFFKILLPATVPYIFTGLRIAIGLSWLAIVAAEMLVGGVGIGFFLWDAWNSSQLSELILAILYVGLVGFLLDRMMGLIADFVMRAQSQQSS